MARRSEDAGTDHFLGKNKIILAILLIVFFVGAFFAGQYFFTTHFFARTTINGVNCSFKNKKDALELINQHLATYTLNIHSEESDMTLSADEVGLVYEQTGDIGDILKKQDAENWIMESFNVHTNKAMKTNLDDDKLSKAIQTLDCMHPKKPEKSQIAKIVYSEEKEEFIIQEATIGNEIDLKPFTAAVKKSILAGDSKLDLTDKKLYVQPKYTSKSEIVLKAKAKIDNYMNTIIHLRDGDYGMDITKHQIHNFVNITDNYQASLNHPKIAEFVHDEVWAKMNNDESCTIIESPGSGTIYVTSNYDNPKVVNVVKERDQLIEDIKGGKETTREPMWNEDFLYSDYGDTIGDTYIDISIYDQEVYVVKDGQVVVASPCVSGAEAYGHGSPRGIYSIKSKTTGYTSIKYKAYFNYWMPYDMTYGIGLHDATWRSESEFVPDTYYYNGSHGCINLPYSKAQEIFGVIEVGYPVIVH